MTKRITVNLSEAQYRAVVEAAEALDRSYSATAARIIDCWRAGDFGDPILTIATVPGETSIHSDSGSKETGANDGEGRTVESTSKGTDAVVAREENDAMDPPGDAPDDAPEAGVDVEAAVAALDIPGAGARADARRAALRDAVEYIRANGSASRGEIRSDVLGDDTLDYADGHSAWQNLFGPKLSALADVLDPLQSPGRAGRRWSWRE